MTNPRIRQEWSPRRKVRPEDMGNANELVMASFVYSGASRFTDGTFGVYYAGFETETAVAESRFHTERFLRLTHQPPTTVYKRMLHARISGRYDDLRNLDKTDPRYNTDPSAYDASQHYALTIYGRNEDDGIVYRSVRHDDGSCVAAFRPRLIRNCVAAEMMLFAFDGSEIDATLRVVAE